MSELVLENENIPKSWIVIPLGEIAETEWGNTSITKKSYVEKGFLAYSATGPDGFLPKSEWIGNGTVLSAIGAKCGKCFYAVGKWTAIKNTIVIQSDEEFILNKYLYYYLNDQRKWNLSGTGQPFITLKTTRENYIPLAPLTEQKRIVEKIEIMWSSINSIRETLYFINKQLNQFNSSYLNYIFNGTSTQIWRKEFFSKLKTNEQLIDKILERSEYKKASKSDFVKTSDLPNSWILCPLNYISKKIVDGTHKTPKYIQKGVMFLSAKNIFEQTAHFENTRFISKNEHDTLIKHCNPEFGDVMLTKSGTIGRTAIVPENLVFSLFESVALIKCNTELVNPEFLSHFLEFYVSKKSIMQTMKGVAVKHFHLEDIRKIMIPLPNLIEQKIIVENMKNTHFQILFHKKSIKILLDILKKFESSILEQAFEGKLVPQDPNDEPAEILLQKIKQEKEQLKQKEKSKREKKNGR